MLDHPSEIQGHVGSKQSGFVLVTSLIMLSLLTMVTLGMFFSSRSATQVSGAAQASTEAYYYAETAINYISWAFHNDAELDSYKYDGTNKLFGEAFKADNANATNVGDYSELMGWSGTTQIGYPSNPGPTAISDSSAAGTSGQVMYFDNTPINDGAGNSRAICFGDAAVFPNCIDLTVAPASRVQPVMNNISASLPRYIMLSIADNGVVTPSIPALPHPATPVVGTDVPNNGAIVWITAAVEDTRAGTVVGNADRDIEIYPVNPKLNSNHSGADPSTCSTAVNASTGCPCDGAAYATLGDWYACDMHANASAGPTLNGAYAAAGMAEWIASYNLVAYAIGYVNGKPTHLLRAVIR